MYTVFTHNRQDNTYRKLLMPTSYHLREYLKRAHEIHAGEDITFGRVLIFDQSPLQVGALLSMPAWQEKRR